MSKTFEVKGDVLIENLINSTLKLIGKIDSLRIKNCSDVKIEVHDSCEGSVYIENVKRSKLIISGDQIRIHESCDSDIFLFAKNSCILEDCENLRFYPNLSAASKSNMIGSDGYWKCVQDFGFCSENSFTYIDRFIDE